LGQPLSEAEWDYCYREQLSYTTLIFDALYDTNIEKMERLNAKLREWHDRLKSMKPSEVSDHK